MPEVRLNYWGGARAAAGVTSQTLEAATVSEALRRVQQERPALGPVLRACSLLLDGIAARQSDLDAPLEAPVVVEVLPPFAGGGHG